MKNERDLLLCYMEWFLRANGADDMQVKMLMVEFCQRFTLPVAGQSLNRREFREKLQKMKGEAPAFLHALLGMENLPSVKNFPSRS